MPPAWRQFGPLEAANGMLMSAAVMDELKRNMRNKRG